METLNKKTLSFPAKIFTQVVAALGIILTLTACGKSDGGNNTTVVAPIYGSGCNNCSAISSPTLLTTFQSQSADGNMSLVNMRVYAQSSGIKAVPSGNNYKSYSGPAAIQGQLVVRVAQYDYVPHTSQAASNCVIPAGTYNVQTSAVGQLGYDGVDVYFPSLFTTVGGIELKIEAPSPMGFLNSGQSLWAKVSVVRVNGIVCSASFYGDFE